MCPFADEMTTGLTLFPVIMAGDCAAAANPAVLVTTNSRREIFSDMATPAVRVCGPACAIVEYSFHVPSDFHRDDSRCGAARVRRGRAHAARAAGTGPARGPSGLP